MRASNLTEAVVRSTYEDQLARFFQPERIHAAIDRRLGRAYLEGWVHEPDADGRDVRVRAFGARNHARRRRQQPGRVRPDHRQERDHAQRRDHQDAGERPGHRSRHPADDGRPRSQTIRSPDTSVRSTGAAATSSIEQVAFTSPNIDKIVAWGGVSGDQARREVRRSRRGADRTRPEDQHLAAR